MSCLRSAEEWPCSAWHQHLWLHLHGGQRQPPTDFSCCGPCCGGVRSGQAHQHAADRWGSCCLLVLVLSYAVAGKPMKCTPVLPCVHFMGGDNGMQSMTQRHPSAPTLLGREPGRGLHCVDGVLLFKPLRMSHTCAVLRTVIGSQTRMPLLCCCHRCA